MKKLMIAAAIVCAAAASQAASVVWSSSGLTQLQECAMGPSGYTGMGGTDYSCVKMIVWEYSATDWTALGGRYETAANIWADYSSGVLTDAAAAAPGYANAGNMAKPSVTGANTWGSETVYAAILFLHTDTENDYSKADHYMGNYGSALATDMGGSALNLGTKIGGTGGDLTWASTQAVPEPTSGLLLLLGVAGLALKRRRV